MAASGRSGQVTLSGGALRAPAVGCAVAVMLWLYHMAAFLVAGPRPWHMPLTVAVAGLAGIGALSLWRWSTGLCLALVGCCLLLSPATIGAAFVAQAVSARRYGWSPVVLLSGGWLATMKIIQLLAGPYHKPWDQASTVESTIGIGGLVVATLLGWLSTSLAAERAWRDNAQAARLDAETARLDQARLQERERIAREMHDVLAHRISLVAMHAGALAYRDDLDTAAVRETAQVIQRNAKQALNELRGVLSGLRDTRSGPEPPQPTLRELPVLVAETRESGTPVRLDLGVTGLADIPSQLSRSAYRILQECLTNARKHAPGAPIEVSLTDGADDDLLLTVSNPLTVAPGRNVDGVGLGLVGVTERVGFLGGTMATTTTDGRFTLTARLPRRNL
jgi:signal transduction histidine kinase